MNTLAMHRVNNIEISTKTLDNDRQSNVVNIEITQEDGITFDLSLFLDSEKKFKALDMKSLFDVIQKHTVIK